MSTLKKSVFIFMALVLSVSVFGCGSKSKNLSLNNKNQGTAPQTTSAALINGAGSTFVNPLFAKMFSEYEKTNKGIQVNYQSVGSGAGIKQLIAKTVDFGASDAPMKADEIHQAGGNVLHIPVTLGGVAIAFNLQGVKDLNLTAQNLADIYNSKIKKWNDPEIVKNNKGIKLPDQDIFPVHRSEGSGTSFIFTSYLNAAVPNAWTKDQVGKSIKWANVGTGSKGNEGVAGQIINTPGSIGYVELAYVIQNNMTAAKIQNKDGQFVAPSLDTVSAAAAGATANMPADMKISLVNQSGKNCYPIVGTTWALIYENAQDKAKTEKVLNLLKWVVTDGQKYASDLQYAPLPKQIQDMDVAQLQKVKVDGQPVLK